MTQPLQPNETLIEGKWLFDGNATKADENCKRIESLISHYFTQIGDPKDWEVLYQDKQDNRFWVLYYPQGHMHGGGPPAIKVINHVQAKEQFNVSHT